MIELKIRGNRENYQLTQKLENIDICLSGQFDGIPQSPIFFTYGNQKLAFKDKNRLLKFSEVVRGATLDKLILTFNEFEFEPSFINSLIKKKSVEIGLLKSIFSIYYWIDSQLINIERTEFENQFFNQFVIDWRNQLDTQNDIYFISRKYVNEKNKPFIKRLMDINLLASFEVNVKENFQITTYFIPLIKPGVSRENFETENDSTGDKTYSLWKNILSDRDIRITNWINMRF